MQAKAHYLEQFQEPIRELQIIHVNYRNKFCSVSNEIPYCLQLLSVVTTLRPQLGMVEYTDLRQITVADLPGLIEGAHANIGLGHKFLKHIERTKMLLMVVDLFGFQLSVIHHLRTCIQNIFALNKELELYDKELIDRPCVLLLNKIDRDNAQIEYDAIKDKVNDLECKFAVNLLRIFEIKWPTINIMINVYFIYSLCTRMFGRATI